MTSFEGGKNGIPPSSPSSPKFSLGRWRKQNRSTTTPVVSRGLAEGGKKVKLCRACGPCPAWPLEHLGSPYELRARVSILQVQHVGAEARAGAGPGSPAPEVTRDSPTAWPSFSVQGPCGFLTLKSAQCNHSSCSQTSREGQNHPQDLFRHRPPPLPTPRVSDAVGPGGPEALHG